MQLGRTLVRTLAVCLVLVSLTSCVVRRRVISRKGGAPRQALAVADKATLVKRVAQVYNSIQNLNATVDLTPALGNAEKGKITEYKDVRGYILFRKPEEIRIIGLYPVVRNKAFDMVSDGKQFKLYLPAKNRFVTGANQMTEPSANKIENLRPQHFLDAMLVKPVAEDEVSLLQNQTDEETASYILHVVGKAPDGALQLLRSIWFDRLTLQISRQISFDAKGNMLSDARYHEWQNYDGVLFPKSIEINRPQDEYGIVLKLVKLDVNKGITDDKFALEQPEGSQLQVLGPKPPPETGKQTPPDQNKGVPSARKGSKQAK